MSKIPEARKITRMKITTFTVLFTLQCVGLGPPNSTTQKEPNNRCGEDSFWCVIIEESSVIQTP